MDFHAPALPLGTGSLARAADYARAEKADATRSAYAKDFAHFSRWCLQSGSGALPAAIETVAAYLATIADAGLSVSTLNRRLAAIAYAHRLKGFDAPGSAEPIRMVMRGIRRTLGTAPKRKAPATAKALGRMLRAAEKHNTCVISRLRDRALLLIGFAAALRRSELVGLDVEHLERSAAGLIIRIGRSKTDQEGEGAEIAVPRGTKLRPVEALDAWLTAAKITTGPVFRQIRRGNHLQAERLSDHAVADIIKRHARAAGLDPKLFSGHSLRAGFVTSALESGADVLKVMDVTRHRSVQTLKGYDRRAKAFKDHAGAKFL
jgi:site-specific recombinase XerD